MDAFIDSTIQLLIEWGLPGLFISALMIAVVGNQIYKRAEMIQIRAKMNNYSYCISN